MTARRLAAAALVALTSAAPLLAEDIDPYDDGSQYAYSENQGWLNAEPLGNGGPGVQVTATALSGYVWAENVGWISLSCANQGTCGTVSYGVSRSGAALSGYAWGENVGWISFSCANQGSCASVSYGVTIGANGVFAGYAWSENVGWISFSDASPFAYQVRTCPTISLPAGLPAATVGAPYSTTISASGGVAPYTYALAAGTLPPGLSLSSGGVLSGTPTTAGVFGFTVTATDSAGCAGSMAYTLNVACPTIALGPASLPNGTVGTAYAQTVSASGGTPPYAFSVIAGSLPAGLTLSSAGVLSGTPTTPGTSSFTVRAVDAFACAGTRPYSITIVCGTITLSPATLPNGTVGSAYGQTIAASGGTPPYTFSLSAGTLPAGLTLTPGGVLSGTPTAPGTSSFTVRAADAVGCQGTRAYTLQIDCAGIALAPSTLPNGTVGSAYAQTITASGGTAPYSFAVTAGALPAGLALSSAGVLSGTPTAPGSASFTVTATDAVACTGSRGYTLTIDCAAITLAPATLPNGTEGSAYSQTLTASGGTAPYTFALTAGSLPAGLTLSSAGVISGTPATAGTSSFTVTATDSQGCTGSQPYTLTIGCPAITLAPPSLPGGTVGAPYAQTITAAGGTAPYGFALSSGSLPPGLALSGAGVISGTPTTAGSYPFTVAATDAGGCSGSRGYTIAVQQGCAGVTITLSPATLPDGTSGVAYAQTLSASGGAAPYAFAVTSGALPAGLTLSAGGVLSGTPTAIGTSSFIVTATDANGCAGARSYDVTIVPAVDAIAGQGLGQPNPNEVKVYTGAGVFAGIDIVAYGAGQWGVNVAAGDLDGDGYGEILTGPGPGAIFGPQARGFFRTGSGMGKVNFYAYGTLKFGVNVGAAALDADRYDEILTGPGPGAVFGPHVRGFNYDNATLQPMAKVSYFAYGTLKFGVNPAQGDVDGDGFGEILTGPGPGAIFGPQVRGWSYDGGSIAAIAKINYNPFSYPGYGANLAGGDFDGDGFDEIATTPGPGPSYPARFVGHNYDGAALAAMPGFDATPFATAFGGRVGAGDVAAAGREALLAGAGRDVTADSTVKPHRYDGTALSPLPGAFVPFGVQTYGVNIVGGALGV